MLMLAILICPLGCGRGIVPCCQAKDPAAPAHPVNGDECDCCQQEKMPADKEDSNEDCLCHEGQCPSDAPCESEGSCQGICGGAVFEKPFVPFFDIEIVLLPLTVLEEPDNYALSVRSDCPRPINHVSGRSLRTLHVSFLC